MTAKPTYRTASYLIEPDPQAPDVLYVTMDICARCGALVHDIKHHDAWPPSGVQMRQKPGKRPALTPEPPTYADFASLRGRLEQRTYDYPARAPKKSREKKLKLINPPPENGEP